MSSYCQLSQIPALGPDIPPLPPDYRPSFIFSIDCQPTRPPTLPPRLPHPHPENEIASLFLFFLFHSFFLWESLFQSKYVHFFLPLSGPSYVRSRCSKKLLFSSSFILMFLVPQYVPHDPYFGVVCFAITFLYAICLTVFGQLSPLIFIPGHQSGCLWGSFTFLFIFFPFPRL